MLRDAVAQLLWSVGLDDLLLHDGAKRVRYAPDAVSLLTHADDCWAALQKQLDQGTLRRWLKWRMAQNPALAEADALEYRLWQAIEKMGGPKEQKAGRGKTASG
jgi:hypothetical protein